MARKQKLPNSNEHIGRQTPRDVKISGTFAETAKVPKQPPRKITKEEEHANNVSMFEFSRQLGRVDLAIPHFKEELEEMNHEKVGRPFEFPDSMVLWIMSLMAAFHMTFRAAAGFACGMLEGHGMKSPSTSRLLERANMLVSDIVLTEDATLERSLKKGVLLLQASDHVIERPRRIGLDSSGFITVHQSLWRSIKWKSEKKTHWLKAHVLQDLDSGEVIAYAITLDSVGDPPMLKPLLEAAVAKGHKFDRVYGDGAYSTDDNWHYVADDLKVEFVTSFKRNTAPRNNGCVERGKAARLWCRTPYQVWTKLTGYSFRWKSECGFSDVKRAYGEEVRAKTVKGQAREMHFKMVVYDCHKRCRAGIMKVTGNGVAIGDEIRPAGPSGPTGVHAS